mgnify:CR=1 FL=1
MEPKEFIRQKKEFLNHQFSHLNDKQREAVFSVNCPLLILAGAGSGKTTVIVNRIAYLLDYGNAYHSETMPILSEEDCKFLAALDSSEVDRQRAISLFADNPPFPWNVLAITFTNKAANELKERLERVLGERGRDVHAGTFHSQCLQILRREIDKLGYQNSFTIYDTDDSIRLIKEALHSFNMSDKIYQPKAVFHTISRAKDAMKTVDDFAQETSADFRQQEIAKIYDYYQKKLFEANALDFDDIIFKTVELFERFPEVLEKYQQRYRYILVDEYQDTNHAQYRLVSLLSSGHRRLCVVGDDDQSIYRFRGATIENILSFEQQFHNAQVVRLEQNYRSTQNILTAANHVIANNLGRKEKRLWTETGDGVPVSIHRVATENEEAELVAKTIMQTIKDGGKYSDHAVLYRMNAQSAAIERYFVRAGIPYKIVGGLRFYDRKEVKDVLAYLNVINNPADDLRLTRIVNEPKRGIGAGTLYKIRDISEKEGQSYFDTMKKASSYAALSNKVSHIASFVDLIEQLRHQALMGDLDELFDSLLELTGYLEYLQNQGVEGMTRLDNIQELKTNMIRFQQSDPEMGLAEFLEEVALYTDLDDYNSEEDKVVLMTLHGAKGLEFPTVFLVGMEEGIFPGFQSTQTQEDLEEERRLAYVGITRARRSLCITNAAQRMLFGNTRCERPSRFIDEIPENVREMEDQTVSKIIHFEEASPSRWKNADIASVGTRTKVEKAVISYHEGDRVQHSVFGDGKVLSMTPMGNDVLVEVEFDTRGKKKIMANFAKLVKA